MTRQRTRREIEAEASIAGGEDVMLILVELLLDIRALLRAPFTASVTIKDGVTQVQMDEDL